MNEGDDEVGDVELQERTAMKSLSGEVERMEAHWSYTKVGTQQQLQHSDELGTRMKKKNEELG